MNCPRTPYWPRIFRGLALSFCLLPLCGQAPLKALQTQELELIRAGLPGRLALANGSLLGIQRSERLGDAHSFKARRPLLDDFGQVHVRYDQLYRGVRVWDGMAIVHVGVDGRTLEPTLALRRDLRQSVEPTVPLAEAQAVAVANLALQDAPALPSRDELVLYPILGERIGPIHAKPGEALNAEDLDRRADYHILAWHIRLKAFSPQKGFISRDFIVDALNGTVHKSWNSLQTSAVVGTGRSQYNGNPPGPGNVSLNTNSFGGGFELKDLTRPLAVHPKFGFTGNVTHNMNHGTDSSTYNLGTLYTDADNTWGDNANYIGGGSTTNDNGQTAGVDAHFGLQATWDYFKNVHNWIGIDNLGSAAMNRVHYSTNYANAFWDDDCFCMTYGDGSGSTKVLTQLDVAGHEMSHGVMSETAGMVYEDECGGLNEANSDIFGTMTEFYTRGGSGSTIGNTGGNWTLGEQIWSTPLRWMYKPSKDGDSFDEWTAGMGVIDVHYTSGPMNRAFYFLAQGASSVIGNDMYTSRLPSGMTGISNDKAARIWFRAVSVYLTPFSLYWDARGACIRAARDLYGSGSAEVAAVKNAFAGINVGAISGGDDTDPVISVTGPGTTTGSMTFSTSPTDNVGVTQVDWFLDGIWWAKMTSAPYSLILDSTQIANGNHELRARARDAAGNVAQSNLLAFTTANTSEQLIFNPTIESGTFGWGANYDGTIWYQATPTNSHSGNYFLWICGFGTTVTNYAFQPLSLPADATSLDLAFWLKVTTNESSSATQDYDKLAIRVYNAAGNVVLGTLATLGNRNAGPYTQRTYSLMPYKGQDVILAFWGTEDSSLSTSFFVDDITVTATVPPPIIVTVAPKPVTLLTGAQATFTATVTGTGNTAVTWSITSGGGSLSGSTATTTTYTAPATAGTAVVRATSQADGSKSDSVTITVKSRDFNGDGSTDILDLASFARAFGATPSSSNWNAAADLNGDGIVDDSDLTLFLAGF